MYLKIVAPVLFLIILCVGCNKKEMQLQQVLQHGTQRLTNHFLILQIIYLDQYGHYFTF